MRDKVILEDQSGKAISPETEITQVKDSNNAPLFVEESGVISVTQGHSIHGGSLADGTINYDKISGAVIPNPTLSGGEALLGSLQLGTIKYQIAGGGSGSVMVKNCSPNEWTTKTWVNLPANVQGGNFWTDGDNVYISMYSQSSFSHYVLDKATSTWSVKTWNGHTDIQGGGFWTDGEDIYYSSGFRQYVLDKSTSTWLNKTWTGFANPDGPNIWTDGENIYFSEDSNQYVLDKATSTWSVKTWNGLTLFSGRQIWTDGENIYYSNGSGQYVLDKATSTWSPKTWTGLTNFIGRGIWTDGDNIYYSNGPRNQYVLDVANSTWNTKSWKGLDGIYGGALYIQGLWTDGDNNYYSVGDTELVLSPLSAHHPATILEKVAETGDYNDLRNIPQEMNISSQEIDEYFEICDVDASVTIEDEDVVLNLTNADIVTENEEPVLTTEVPNVSVQNNILEIE